MGLKKIYKKFRSTPEVKRFIEGGRQQIRQITKPERGRPKITRIERKIGYVAQETGRIILGRPKPIIKTTKKIKRRKTRMAKRKKKKRKRR